MKFATTYLNVNPKHPVKQAGFIQQVNPISEVNDDLMARVIYLEDQEIVIMISIDNLGLPLEFQLKVQERLQQRFDKKVNLTISSTHTHFAGDPRDVEYQNQILEEIEKGVAALQIKEYQALTYSFTYEYFDRVGKSRISKQESDSIYLEVVSIYGDGTRLANLMIYNCHPTILSGLTPYFSAEYPGYSIGKLRGLYPGEFFTFMQGADGDISTRFTRSGQEYDSVEELGNIFVEEVQKLLQKELPQKEVKLSYTGEYLPLIHEILDLETLEIPTDITDREKETIEFGKVSREKLLKDMDKLPKSILISKVDFGDYKMIFAPNELFSYYIKALEKDHASLVCYSNGYRPYVTGIGKQRITYELFTDTYSKETKEQLFALLKKYSQ